MSLGTLSASFPLTARLSMKLLSLPHPSQFPIPKPPPHTSLSRTHVLCCQMLLVWRMRGLKLHFSQFLCSQFLFSQFLLLSSGKPT